MTNQSDNIQHYASRTDPGLVADINEDSVYASDGLWVIADGMGGHACGDVASQQAIKHITTAVEQKTDISVAIQQAHEIIVQLSKQEAERKGMGTTIVVAKLLGDSLEIAWVGDSRAYLWDGDKNSLSQLTRDHSLIEKLLEANVITPEQAREHPKRHVITQCLGSLDVEQLQVDTLTMSLQKGQLIMLCSDGLTDELTDEELAQVLTRNDTVDAQAGKLVEQARLAGGSDNISVILIAAPDIEHQNFWNKLTAVFR